jgi:hypothetical protein
MIGESDERCDGESQGGSVDGHAPVTWKGTDGS